MKRFLLIIFSLLPTILVVKASDLEKDSISLPLRFVERYQVHHTFALPYTVNPALMPYRYDSDLTSFGLSYDWDHQSRALIPSKGNGYRGFQVGADSYKSLSKNRLVWGYAKYDRGVKKDVVWNSTDHFEKLYPYVIGNSKAGDMKSEQYAFSGGVAQSHKWGNWGVQMEYLAGHQYRAIDPRPRDISSDLHIDAGFAMNIKDRYLLGIKLGIENYKQRGNFTFFDELGAEPQYILSGLGDVFERFNESKLSIDYRSLGYRIGLNLIPNDKRGLYLDVSAEFTSLERILTSGNKVPINSYKEKKGLFQLGYLGGQFDRWTWGANIEGIYQRRKGMSHIVGDPKGGSYPIEGYLPMFGMERASSTVSAFIEGHGKSWWWHCTPEVEYQSLSIAVVYPDKQLNDKSIDFVMKSGLGIQWKKNVGYIGLSLGYIRHFDSLLDLPQLYIRKPLLEHIQESYAQLSHDRLYYSVSPHLFFQLSNKMGLGLNITYRVVNLGTQNTTQQLLSGINLIF